MITPLLAALIATLILLPADLHGISLEPASFASYATLWVILASTVWACLELVSWGFWSCVRNGVAWAFGCIVVAGVVGVFLWGLLFG